MRIMAVLDKIVDACNARIISGLSTKYKNPTQVSLDGVHKSGNDLLSRYSHYHWPQALNGRVRNGNGCGHLGMVTGKFAMYQKVAASRY